MLLMQDSLPRTWYAPASRLLSTNLIDAWKLGAENSASPRGTCLCHLGVFSRHGRWLTLGSYGVYGGQGREPGGLELPCPYRCFCLTPRRPNLRPPPLSKAGFTAFRECRERRGQLSRSCIPRFLKWLNSLLILDPMFAWI